MTIQPIAISMTIAAALIASMSVSAQTRIDRTFTASGTSCDEITWSKEMLAQYPKIAEACQEVLQRDGRYYVKFQGEVRRVASRGQEVTIAFKEGDLLTLTPPENMSLFVNNRPTPVRNLRPGDQLNFYVPEHQLTAQFFEGDETTATAREVPIRTESKERVAMETPETRPSEAQLPATAGPMPLFGLAGALLAGIGAALTIRRRLQRRP